MKDRGACSPWSYKESDVTQLLNKENNNGVKSGGLGMDKPSASLAFLWKYRVFL